MVAEREWRDEGNWTWGWTQGEALQGDNGCDRASNVVGGEEGVMETWRQINSLKKDGKEKADFIAVTCVFVLFVRGGLLSGRV